MTKALLAIAAAPFAATEAHTAAPAGLDAIEGIGEKNSAEFSAAGPTVNEK